MSKCKPVLQLYENWNQETALRHVTRPFYKNMNLETKVKDKQVKKVILEMTDRIIEKFNPIKIILFGSQARNEANADSDIDLLVVVDNEADYNKIHDEILPMIGWSPYPKDILVQTENDFKKSAASCGYTSYYALKEGVVLYE